MSHMPPPKIICASAKIARYQSVRRRPMESLVIAVGLRPSNHACVGADHIADAAHGVNQLGTAGRIDLVAQKAHEGVERILFDVAVEPPDRLDERAPGNHLTGA